MSNQDVLRNQLAALLDPYDSAQTECDGQTRILSSVLNGIEQEHVIWEGSIWLGEKQIMSTHFWIETEGLTIDYRARMWCREQTEGVPHGVFNASDYPLFRYEKTREWSLEEFDVPGFDSVVFQILTYQWENEPNRDS